MSADGYVAQVAVRPDGAIEVAAVPTVLNAERLPVLAEGSDFERIHDRLSRLSPDFGAVVERVGKALSIRPAGKG
jgi:hypothetical protein